MAMLARADVVICDGLADPRLLEHAPAAAERIAVGCRSGPAGLRQDQINQLMLDHARRGRFVVRLKGGDPYLFGRGAEEVSFLAARGIPCEVVPGVTAGIAAPMAAGIPMTRRDVASTVTFVTGHEDPEKEAAAVDYGALAALIGRGGSACFYMGARRAGRIVQALQGHGLRPDTPVAIVQWGFTPRQLSLRTTIAAAADAVERSGLGSPAILVIGAVAGLREPGLDFYTGRALFGARVVVTRTRQQASALSAMLADLGADVMEAPTIELAPPADWGPVDAAIRDLGTYDWLVLTSVNGVEGLAGRLAALGLDARHLASIQVAAIGDATAAALSARLGIRADLLPERFVAESLAEALLGRDAVRGRRFLMLRADIARPALRQMLREGGAEVDDPAIYETHRPAGLPAEVLQALRQRRVDWVTFTSSSTATNFVDLLGEEAGLLRDVKRASIGPVTSQTLRRLGFDVTVEATTSNMGGLVEAMATAHEPRL